MKEFTTALKAADEPEDEPITFAIDGHEITCYRPTVAQFAIAMSAIGERNDLQRRLAGIIDFFVEILDDDSRWYIENRLLDRKDPFGLDEIEQIMEWMIEEWSARPTAQPSGSTRSASSGGPKSTRRTTRRTSSATASTGT